jgi:hypothetical protein
MYNPKRTLDQAEHVQVLVHAALCSVSADIRIHAHDSSTDSVRDANLSRHAAVDGLIVDDRDESIALQYFRCVCREDLRSRRRVRGIVGRKLLRQDHFEADISKSRGPVGVELTLSLRE